MPAHSHVMPAASAASDDPQSLARWEDDGGPAHEPRHGTRAAHWLRIGAALTTRLPELAGRDDVIVTCQPGTRSGAPAAFFPTTAQLEVDAKLFAPAHPATINPERHGDEENYPVVWGAFTHEAAHAAHSRWNTPPALRGTAQGSAAELLEESRAEHAHLRRRPDDRRWLRAVASTLILEDCNANTVTDPWRAATAAGLILARREAHILTHEETEPLQDLVTKILGPQRLDTLAAIWKAAQATGDEDEQSMLAHVKAWCEVLGTPPGGPEPAPSVMPGTTPGELASAVAQVATSVEINIRAEAAEVARQQARRQQAAQAQQGAALAKEIFAQHGNQPRPSGINPRLSPGRASTPITGTRPPTAGEKSAASHLARALRAAAYREPTETRTASAAPPGRLNMRGALARDAQRAAGAVPTAQPWITTRRRQGPIPPLRVGIAVDVSGSMKNATRPMASAAWIVAKAATLADPDSRTATVAYSSSLTAITAPGRVPPRVTTFKINGFSHRLADTLDALTAGLDLTTPGTGRLIVIASDGHYSRGETATAAERITALRAAGCAVLWLAFDVGPLPLPGSTLVHLTQPAQAAAVISKAATAALTAANS